MIADVGLIMSGSSLAVLKLKLVGGGGAHVIANALRRTLMSSVPG